MKKKRLTVFASGSGSNFKALHQAVLENEIPASITALISDNPKAKAIEYAKYCGISTYILSPKDFSEEAAWCKSLEAVLADGIPDLIVLAGFLKKIPEPILSQYPKKIINIHPSLLPKYGGKGWYGKHVHRAVIQNRDSESGCTVHWVNNIYDGGPVIAQKRVPVYPDDTPESLAERVLREEHRLYPKVVKELLLK